MRVLYEGWGDKALLDQLEKLSSKSRQKRTVICEECGFVNVENCLICLHCRRESRVKKGPREGKALLAQSCKQLIWCHSEQKYIPKRGVQSLIARQMETLLAYKKRLTDPRRVKCNTRNPDGYFFSLEDMWDHDPVWRMNVVQFGHTRDTLPQLWRLIGRAQEMKDEHKATGGLSVSQRGAWYSNRQWELDQGKSGHAGTRSFDNKGKPTQSFKGKQAQQASD